MEAGDLPLEALIAAYQRGAELIKYCSGQLDSVEQQVKILEDDLLKPFVANPTNAMNVENAKNTMNTLDMIDTINMINTTKKN